MPQPRGRMIARCVDAKGQRSTPERRAIEAEPNPVISKSRDSDLHIVILWQLLSPNVYGYST
jgi:hypothetical protein